MTSSDLEFREDIYEDALKQFRFRELLRGNKGWQMPTGVQGFVVEDLDLVLRWKGELFGLDEVGRFRLVELKRRGTALGPSKEFTFGLVDYLCRLARRFSRYDGFYLVEHSNDLFDESTVFWVNSVEMSCDEFLDWCLEPYSHIPSYRWVGYVDARLDAA